MQTMLMHQYDEDMKKKRPAMSRFELKEKRKEHTPISIDITVDDEPHTIEVLRSVNAKDALYVKYDASTLGYVLKYMRDNGFTEMKPNFKHTGAKGILKREGGFVVVSMQPMEMAMDT